MAQTFQLGDVTLRSGEILKNAEIAYTTYGTLNSSGTNAIIYPTHYGSSHKSNEPMIGPGRALDPTKYFIIVPNMFGNGVSTSPSNYKGESHSINSRAVYPHVTIYDNVQCQCKLLDHLQVKSLALAFGWSMGAQQSYQWAVSFPDRVRSVLAVCGTARTSPHNYVFLEGVKAALQADSTWNNGNYTSPPVSAFGRVYAGWAYSQAFFRDGLYKQLGLGVETVEELLQYWEADSLNSDANDLLAMVWTWQNNDVSVNSGLSFEETMKKINVPVIVMPTSTDLYFPPEDLKIDADLIPNSEFREIKTLFGHIGGGPNRVKTDTEQIEAAIRDLLARTSI